MGAVIVSFIVVTEWLTEVMIHGQALGAVRFAAPVLGALAAGFLMHRWFGEARGSGIPQTKAALVANDGRIPFRTAFGKYVCGVLTLGAGIPLGREGPSAQIGAGIASSVGEALGLDTEQRRQLIPVGTAAAIAAAFNTPIAAILFSLEEIVGNLHARVLGLGGSERGGELAGAQAFAWRRTALLGSRLRARASCGTPHLCRARGARGG